MILVDSGVWIDHLADRSNAQTHLLGVLIHNREPILVGDLILMEVLQGTRSDRDAQRTLDRLSLFEPLTITDTATIVEAARNYRHLRSLGITVRKTIDTLIATRCILDRIPLLYSDRDFDPFVRHLGLRSALDIPGAS